MEKQWKNQRAGFLGVGIATILAAGACVGLSLVLQYVIDFTLNGRVKEAVTISVLFLILLVVALLTQSIGLVVLNQNMMKQIRAGIMEKILHKSYLDFGKYKDSDYISLLTNDMKKIEDTYIPTLFAILMEVVQLLFAIIIMTRYSWVFTVIMLAMTVLMFLVPTYFSEKMQQATGEVSESQQTFTQGASEIIGGFEVIRSYQQESRKLNKIEQVNNQLRQTVKKLGILTEMNRSVSNILAFIMQMTICILAAYFIYRGKMSYGSMVGVIQVSGSITSPIFGLFSEIPRVKSIRPIWKKIEDYTSETEEKPTIGSMPQDWKEIRLEDVGFRYPEEVKMALDHVSLNIERGKKYLITGESGGGKSTLVKVLCGYYKPEDGRILVDGKEQVDIQEHVAMMHQNVFLFNESIRENVTMGEKGSEFLQRVLAEVNLTSLIKEKGVDFVVGENGDQLSGGQKQRVALARAFFAGRDIVVLDEGLSAIDPQTAKEIEESLLKREDITLLSISHHILPGMQELYDEVIQVKDGRM